MNQQPDTALLSPPLLDGAAETTHASSQWNFSLSLQVKIESAPSFFKQGAGGL